LFLSTKVYGNQDRWIKVKIVKAMDAIKAALQTVLFHMNTFNPSNSPKGIRLTKAIHAFQAALNIAIF